MARTLPKFKAASLGHKSRGRGPQAITGLRAGGRGHKSMGTGAGAVEKLRAPRS
jgi:hypothetical protein